MSRDDRVVTVRGRFLGPYHAHRLPCEEFAPSDCEPGGFMPFERTSATTSPFVELTVRAVRLANGLWRALETSEERALSPRVIELAARAERECPDAAFDARRAVESAFRRIARADDPNTIDATRLDEVKKHAWAKGVISAKSPVPCSSSAKAASERCLDRLSVLARKQRDSFGVVRCVAPKHPGEVFAPGRACLNRASSEIVATRSGKRKRVGRKYRKRRAVEDADEDDVSSEFDDDDDEEEEDDAPVEIGVDEKRIAPPPGPIVVPSAHRTFAATLLATLEAACEQGATLVVDPDESFVDRDVERFVRMLPEVRVAPSATSVDEFDHVAFRTLLKSSEFVGAETLARFSARDLKVLVELENAPASTIVDELRAPASESRAVLVGDGVDALPFVSAFELDSLRIGDLVAVDGYRDFGVLESAKALPGGRALPKKSRAFVFRARYELSLRRPNGSRFSVDTERAAVRNAAGGFLRDWLGPIVDRVDLVCGRDTPRVSVALAAKYCSKKLVLWFCECRASTLRGDR